MGINLFTGDCDYACGTPGTGKSFELGIFLKPTDST